MSESKIMLFQIADLAQIHHLQPTDWSDITRHMLDYCLQSFCIPIKFADNGHIVGIGSLILHQDSAWLAHIIVAEDYRGMGIGAQIVKHLLQLANEKGKYSVSLIATELGKPLYEKCGFRSVENYQFFKKGSRFASESLSPFLRSAEDKHVQQILVLDSQCTGESRSLFIQNYLSLAVVYERNGQVEGYYLPHLKEGPIYAITAEAGLALLALKCTNTELVAIPQSNVIGIAYLINCGFEKQDKKAVRMAFGDDITCKPQHIYSRIGGNYG